MPVSPRFFPVSALSLQSIMDLKFYLPVSVRWKTKSERSWETGHQMARSVNFVAMGQVLAPTLQPDDILVLDNLSTHKVDGIKELIEARGARLEYLPFYSPDFNPIEECISKIKEILCSLKARTRRKLNNALARAIEMISIDDICGWFAHCGYVFSLK